MSVAVRFHATGPPEVLVPEDVPPPEPGPGQVRVAVVAAGVNPAECRIRRGEVAGALAAPGPWGLGTDVAGVAGVVDAVAVGAPFAVGDEVLGRALGGAYAEYALAVQLAVLRGARVLGTAGPANLDRVRALGAEAVAHGPGWAERVRARAPDGVDAALDAAGAGVLAESVALAGGPGRVVTIADRRSAAAHRVTYSRGLVARVPIAEVLAELLPALFDGRIRVHVAHRVPLAEAARAHRISEAGPPV